MPRGTPAEIAFWLGTRRVLPSVADLMDAWGISRAAAFRWRAFARSNGRSQYCGAPRSKRKSKEQDDDE